MLQASRSRALDVLIIADDTSYRIVVDLLEARGIAAALLPPAEGLGADTAPEASLVVVGGLTADAASEGWRAFNRCAADRRCIVVLEAADPEAVSDLYRKGAAVVFVQPVDFHHLFLQCAYFLDRARAGGRAVRLGTAVFDAQSRQIRTADGEGDIRLTEAETRILILLSDRIGQTVAKDEISEFVFHKPYDKYDRRIDVHISNIRRKLRDFAVPARIDSARLGGVRLTIDRGLSGQVFDPDAARAAAEH